MTNMSRQYRLATSHGAIAIEESGGGGIPVLLIHGNSSCRGVFRNQMEGALGRDYRLIAFDLPGHGESENAQEPSRTYTRLGFADAAIEILDLLGIDDVVLLGWSLGGHIAMEVAPQLSALRGMMICGAPPVGSSMAEAFMLTSHMKLAGQERLTPSEIDMFGEAIFGTAFAPFLRAAIERTDGRARKTLFEAAHAGAGVNQRWVVENLPVPVAVVNSADDPFLNLDYIDSLDYANLWEGRCHRLPGAKHAPLWEAPAIFNPVLERFLDDVSGRRVASPSPENYRQGPQA
ncbi:MULTISPECIES: alpha/beta fold hydrolase [unclassified Sinorhizobium]|uniref:alpha/beta fold hydrolase n=1 Tax=unclassified Sinorhizobium TaxID=2613772 RepID=UPI0035269F84